MKVYFNNSCKICKAEIDLYKKEKIPEIDWVDITNNDLAEKETSKNSKELLNLLFSGWSAKPTEKFGCRLDIFSFKYDNLPTWLSFVIVG